MSEPPSWQQEAGALPRELVTALRGAPGEPNHTQLELLAENLGSSLGHTLSATNAATATKALVAKPALGVISSTLLGFVVGAGLSAAVAVSFTRSRPESSRGPAALPSIPRPLPSSASISGVDQPEPLPPPEVPKKALPRPSPLNASAGAETSPLETIEAEVALLRQARETLASNPNRALALCADHARMFAGGALGQEREVIAIEALLRAGARAQARERGQRFLNGFPGSAHVPRVTALLQTTGP